MLRHPWRGPEASCEAAKAYLRALPERAETQAQTLADLTGWDIEKVRRRAGYVVIDVDLANPGDTKANKEPWWKRLWQ
ncbi:MAG: hypothetical protein E6J87_03915 [Deltaproteobacteria bacterium]|nr:MAG: hypothetical protein E6J87_03915 [Deltaproteobacteria bacterium]